MTNIDELLTETIIQSERSEQIIDGMDFFVWNIKFYNNRGVPTWAQYEVEQDHGGTDEEIAELIDHLIRTDKECT